jgi:hypothetical protein
MPGVGLLVVVGVVLLGHNVVLLSFGLPVVRYIGAIADLPWYKGSQFVDCNAIANGRLLGLSNVLTEA